MGRTSVANKALLLVLLVLASSCVALAQTIASGTAEVLGRRHYYPHTHSKCKHYWSKHKRYPSWCKVPPPSPSPSPTPGNTSGEGYFGYMKASTANHWKMNVRKNMYPNTYQLQQARGNLTLFAGDHNVFSLAALPRQPSEAALAGPVKPATDDMAKAGLKAAGTAASGLGKYVLDCVTKTACAQIFSNALGTFATALATSFPKLLNIASPLLGIAIQVLIALFWPDMAGPPPVTLDQVKSLIDKKVIEATDKLGQQLLASIALYTDASIGEAIANIEIETAKKALGQNSAFMSASTYFYNVDPCAQRDANGDCMVMNQELYNSLKDLVVNVIPNTLEKIFPSDDPTITDYAAARRIPYIVAFGQLALPLLFQWAWMADGMASPGTKPSPVNWRLNAQLRKTIVALMDNIDSAITQSIARRTNIDMQFYYWDATQTGANLPFQCGNTVNNKALRWCVTDTYPGGAKNMLVMPFQGISDSTNDRNAGGDPDHRFLMFRRVGMVKYAQSVRWGITSPLLYASLSGAASPAKTWALWGVDLRQSINNNATAQAAVTPVLKMKVAHVGPIGGSCTFQAIPWWEDEQARLGCTPDIFTPPNKPQGPTGDWTGCDGSYSASHQPQQTEDWPYYLCLQCLNGNCAEKYPSFCNTFCWDNTAECHIGQSFADYLGDRQETDVCNAGANKDQLRDQLAAECNSAQRRDWVAKGCGTPEHRRNEMNTIAWTRYRKCWMPVPSVHSGMNGVCHNSFVNGKATVEDIYTSDRSKWVSESARYDGGCHHEIPAAAGRSCDCRVSNGNDIWGCGTGYNGHEYEARRYLPPLNYPDTLTPSQDKQEGFSAGGKFPFDFYSLGNITGITMGFTRQFHQFTYVGVNYTSGKRLVTPDYARTYELMHQFDKPTPNQNFQMSWCEVKLGPGQLITGAVAAHDMGEVYYATNPETRVSEKSFFMRGITFYVSNVNETDWTVSPAFNVTCGDPPGSPSLSPDAVKAGIDKTFITSAPEGGYGLIDNNLTVSVDSGHDAWLCHLDVMGILGDEVKPTVMNFITGFKFSWCWNQLEMPAPQDWEDCIRNGGGASCSPDIPIPPQSSPSPNPPVTKPSPSPKPATESSPSPKPATESSPSPKPATESSPSPDPVPCTAVNWDTCPMPVLTNSSRYCWNQPTAFCTCYINARQVSGCEPPACYPPTQFNCRDTVKQRGWQTLSPCKDANCAGKCTITAGYPWDDDCRPEVGNK